MRCQPGGGHLASALQCTCSELDMTELRSAVHDAKTCSWRPRLLVADGGLATVARQQVE